jgi:hypothetical protein
LNLDHNDNQTNYHSTWEGGGRPHTTNGVLLKQPVDPKVLQFLWVRCTSAEDYQTVGGACQLFQEHGYD